MRIRRGSRTLVAALVVGLVVALTGCSGDDKDEPGDGGAGSGSSAEPGIDTRVEVGEVAGKLPKKAARTVAADVSAVVDRWLDGAYVAGDYPRSDFGDAFRGFSKGAAALAARQPGLMSNKAIGDDVDGVTATRRVVRVDLLAPRGKPAGATAHINLVIEITGDVERTDQVRGRLVLTKGKGGWQVFGFDIERGEVKG